MSTKWMDGINAEAMEKWMADLRSGEFTQAVGVLKSKKDGGMCCLGVATDTNAEACGLVLDDSWVDRYNYHLPSGQSTTALMPTEVMNHLGIPDEYRVDGTYDGSIFVVADQADVGEKSMCREYNTINGRQMIDVVSLNDSLGKSFAEIADRFEATFKVEEENK